MLNLNRMVVFTGLFVAACQAQTAKPLEFDVVSVKPTAAQGNGTSIRISNGSLTVTGATLKQLITMCYGILDFQISGGPGWIVTDRFDVEAKAEAPSPLPDGQRRTDAQLKVFDDQFKERVQIMLADRFQLQVRESTKEMSIYALVQAKDGSKLVPADAAAGNQGTHMNRGTMTATASTMDSLAKSMSGTVGRPVVNKTGLLGKFDWKLEWSPETGQMKPQVPGETPTAVIPETAGPSIFTALQEQLGLKLEAQKGPAPVLVIERAEKPSPN